MSINPANITFIGDKSLAREKTNIIKNLLYHEL